MTSQGAPLPIRPAVMGAAAIAAFVLLCVPIFSFDTPWHLAAGQWMLKHRALLESDPFSYSFPGAPWENHAIGFQLVLACAVEVLGIAGATLLPALTGAGLCVVGISAVDRREPKHVAVAALLMVTAIGGARESLIARPHTLAFLCTAVVVLSTLRLCDNPRSRLRWALPFVILAWTTLHNSHVLAPALVLVPLGTLLASRKKTEAKALALFGGIPAVVAMVIASAAYLRFLEHSDSSFLRQYIGEWEPVTVELLVETSIGNVWLVIAALATAGGLLEWQQGDRTGSELPRHLLLVGATVAVPLTVSRALPLYLVGLSPLWLPSAAHAIYTISTRMGLQREGLKLVVWSAALIAIIAMSLGSSRLGRLGVGFDASRFPVHAVDKLATIDMPGHTFHAYNYGGYLAWRGVPADGVLVDGRAITLYPAPFLNRFSSAYGDPTTFQAIVDHYDITKVLLPVGSSRAQLLVERLTHDPSWNIEHIDDTAVLFIKVAAPP